VAETPLLARQVLLSEVTKEAATLKANDLHSLRLSSTFPEELFRLAERLLASPFLTPSTCLFEIVAPEMGPLFFASELRGHRMCQTKCAIKANSNNMKTPPTQIRKFSVIFGELIAFLSMLSRYGRIARPYIRLPL
jgi:hypothetical protein